MKEVISMTLEDIRDSVLSIMESKGYKVVNDEDLGIKDGIWRDVVYPMVVFSPTGDFGDHIYITEDSHNLGGRSINYIDLESLKRILEGNL